MEAAGKGREIKVRILGSAGCANTPPTVELVKNMAKDLNISVSIEMVMVGTQQQAQGLRFWEVPQSKLMG